MPERGPIYWPSFCAIWRACAPAASANAKNRNGILLTGLLLARKVYLVGIPIPAGNENAVYRGSVRLGGAQRRQPAESAALRGGVGGGATRHGDARLAAHLVDWAADAEPASREVRAARAAVYRALMEAVPSTMSRGIYGAAARESEAKAVPG
jgi:hypothetical protein